MLIEGVEICIYYKELLITLEDEKKNHNRTALVIVPQKRLLVFHFDLHTIVVLRQIFF